MQKKPQIAVHRSICQNLRTKASYVPGVRTENYLIESDPMTQYWCVKTMKVIGPDDKFVVPEDCMPERKCFKSLLDVS
ncbi:MAG: hypothetical protein ACE5PV_12590 [Candidatus Poribacteria bacterium]